MESMFGLMKKLSLIRGDIVEERKAYYAVIPATIRYDNNLKDKAKLLYGEITALTNEKGFCWATNSYFADLYKITKETVSRLLKNLSDNGYIKIELVYKNKEIIGRKIYIETSIPNDKKINTYCENNQEPIDENDSYPIDQKVKENNTSINNTINNTLDNTISKDIVSSTNVQQVIEEWNKLNLQKIISIKSGTARYKMLNARVKEYGIENILKAISSIENSAFLNGQNNRSWVITFDWFIKPNNFQKVLEGNYVNRNTSNVISMRNEKPPLRFNNFEPRDYYNDEEKMKNLENKLLGWGDD